MCSQDERILPRILGGGWVGGGGLGQNLQVRWRVELLGHAQGGAHMCPKVLLKRRYGALPVLVHPAGEIQRNNWCQEETFS